MGVKMTDRVGSSIQSCVVGIMMEENVVGTGFFVSRDGQILTCFHVIGDCGTGRLYSSQLKIKFENSEYSAAFRSFTISLSVNVWF